jgi:hypothetical protein
VRGTADAGTDPIHASDCQGYMYRFVASGPGKVFKLGQLLTLIYPAEKKVKKGRIVRPVNHGAG